MGWEALQGPEWEQWLLAVAGKNRVRMGQSLDPFGSSWRRLHSQAKPWMTAIQKGEPIPRTVRPNQVPTDLGGVALMTGKSLSDFGTAVLERWKEMPGEWEYEMPLALALLQEGLARDADGFRGMLGFWWDIKQVFDEKEILSDRGGDTLILLPVLNQEVKGFNPWVTVRESEAPDPSFPWEALQKRQYAEPDRAMKALNKLNRKLEENRPLKPRIVFCRAMSLMFEHRQGRGAQYLENLKLPRRYSR